MSKMVSVTGAAAGIGRACAMRLARYVTGQIIGVNGGRVVSR